MKTNLTLFTQIVKSLVNKYYTDKILKVLIAGHTISMLFCQFSKLNFLRNIINDLRSTSVNLNHLELLKALSKYSLDY